MVAAEAGQVSARRRVLVEACVDSIDGAMQAEWGGADRIELSGELLQGGVTPSHGLIEAVWDQLSIPLFVLIRPRTGDFLYTADELDVMERDIRVMRSLHVDGIVAGALTTDGDVDVGAMRCIIDAARPMEVTFHRAFDFVRDQDAALDALIELGVERVLTSGGAPSALQGAECLARLTLRAGSDLTVMAGGGITAANVAEVIRRSGVREVHLRAAERVPSAMKHRRRERLLSRRQPPPDDERVVTRQALVREVREAIQDS
ncbi:MAG TPA: copper homeostasis protein CutC [Gemmatimonadaceae bacterium]|nr:copper homeostasis protein CutC [Gemmatimonadaceae bacterium]